MSQVPRTQEFPVSQILQTCVQHVQRVSISDLCETWRKKVGLLCDPVSGEDLLVTAASPQLGFISKRELPTNQSSSPVILIVRWKSNYFVFHIHGYITCISGNIASRALWFWTFLEFQYGQADSSVCYRNSEVWLYTGVWKSCLNPPPELDIGETSQELRMLSSATLNCQEPKTVMNSGSQLSE